MKLVETHLVCGSIAETPQGVCLFPPLVLDRISADWALAWALRDGNDLLAHYTGLTRNGPPDLSGIFAPREKMEQGQKHLRHRAHRHLEPFIQHGFPGAVQKT